MRKLLIAVLLTSSAFAQKIDLPTQTKGILQPSKVLTGTVNGSRCLHTNGAGTQITESASECFDATVPQNVSFNGALNVVNYGAKCDGVTDDTAAFQAASDAAFISVHPSAVIVPATGNECIISQWNLTGLIGQQGGSPTGSIHVFGQSGEFGQQSTIRCKEASANTGVCIDLSGSDQVTIEGLRILGGSSPSDSPKVVILTARTTTDLGWSNGFYFRNLDIETYGKFGWYSYGGEEVKWENARFIYNGTFGGYGESDIVLTNSNVNYGITSPFKTLMTGNVSMTQVMFDDGTILGCFSLNSDCIRIESDASNAGGVDNIKIYGYANLGSDNARSFLSNISTGEMHNILLDNRVEVSHVDDTFLKLGNSSIKGLRVYSTFDHQHVPSAAPIQFTNASGTIGEGSVIDYQPADQQGFYPATIVSCAMAEDHIFGLVIYNRDATGGVNTGVSCPGSIQYPGHAGYWSINGAGVFKINGLTQNAASKFAGKCAMSASTTCTFTLASTFTNYVSFVSLDQASTPPATAISAKCSISGTTVTVTAGTSNSLTWDCLFVGNPF